MVCICVAMAAATDTNERKRKRDRDSGVGLELCECECERGPCDEPKVMCGACNATVLEAPLADSWAHVPLQHRSKLRAALLDMLAAAPPEPPQLASFLADVMANKFCDAEKVHTAIALRASAGANGVIDVKLRDASHALHAVCMPSRGGSAMSTVLAAQRGPAYAQVKLRYSTEVRRREFQPVKKQCKCVSRTQLDTVHYADITQLTGPVAVSTLPPAHHITALETVCAHIETTAPAVATPIAPPWQRLPPALTRRSPRGWQQWW